MTSHIFRWLSLYTHWILWWLLGCEFYHCRRSHDECKNCTQGRCSPGNLRLYFGIRWNLDSIPQVNWEDIISIDAKLANLPHPRIGRIGIYHRWIHNRRGCLVWIWLDSFWFLIVAHWTQVERIGWCIGSVRGMWNRHFILLDNILLNTLI